MNKRYEILIKIELLSLSPSMIYIKQKKKFIIKRYISSIHFVDFFIQLFKLQKIICKCLMITDVRGKNIKITWRRRENKKLFDHFHVLNLFS